MSYIKNIIHTLVKKNISVSVAESYTGGLLSKAFTDNSGISIIFKMGLITYSDESKSLILKIPKNKIKKYGAVSKEISILMSKNLYKISNSKLTISTTGIAGPLGGSKLKPVGLGYISITYLKKTHTFKKIFKGNRSKIEKDTVSFCFNKIKNLI